MKKASIKELADEVQAIATEKGFPLSKSETVFLIDRIGKEFEELNRADENNESPDRLAEEAIDVLVQCVQLILALGLSPEDVYRRKMDKNWQRNWERHDSGEFKSV